ncbi:DUF416 family protein [Endozoicomonas sp. SCSIO W0465]|uniref:DUF416 family protein n=1 Tax=Endozoicomonas sp. SCSIO W0465 TaxID=2918516 RepID=UPI00207512AF|nr:DUF416 family protein [Endozoicomonas sp. SCSIO W0465]USE35384.1 YjaG family protein [Endozoicomonas sp. SCSIO W0465]
MNTRKLYAQYSRQIELFSPWQLTALATAVTERAWPNFALFSELAEFGQPVEVRHCLNLLWDYTAGLQSAKNFERLLERLDENTPVPEDFDMFGVQPALDFSVSLNCAIHCAMKASVDEAASALTVSLSTIGKFIKYTEAAELKGTELTQYIEEHELFEIQCRFIRELISMIGRQKNPLKNLPKRFGCFLPTMVLVNWGSVLSKFS